MVVLIAKIGIEDEVNRQQQEQVKEYLLQVTALLESINTNVSADSDSMKYAGYKQYIRKYNQLVRAISQVINVGALIDLYNVDQIPGIGDTLDIQRKELFDSVHANLSILKAYLEGKLDLKSDEITNLINFFQASLRRAIFRIPEKETEIQDVIEQLLIGRGLAKGIDYDRETGRVKVSIKEFKPDFIFPRLGLALEVKLSKNKEKSREIVDDINADINAYSKKYPYLLFVIYDLGTIRDEAEFKQSLESPDGISVIVIKH